MEIGQASYRFSSMAGWPALRHESALDGKSHSHRQLFDFRMRGREYNVSRLALCGIEMHHWRRALRNLDIYRHLHECIFDLLRLANGYLQLLGRDRLHLKFDVGRVLAA